MRELKCGWTHCSCGVTIYDDQEKVKIGKRWFHKECAEEKTLIEDIVTKFLEQVNPAEIPVLRRVVNDIVFNEVKPAQYVMFALDYAIAHPQMRLTYPAGLYRICNDLEVQKAWCKQQADKAVGSHKIDIKQLNRSATQIHKTSPKRAVSDLFE